MSASLSSHLLQDRKGMAWDLVLYVPTVFFLAMLSIKFWYANNTALAYLLVFLSSFFALVGGNRILKTRLMLLPSAPTTLEVDINQVGLVLRSGEKISLVKDLRFYPDFSGKSFGLSGIDLAGRRQQFVFHKAQFASQQIFSDFVETLKKYR